MQPQIRRMASGTMLRWSAGQRRTSASSLYLVFVLIFVVSANVASAIVKQQQQQQQQPSQSSQQQRSDDPSQQAYNNHQHPNSGGAPSGGPQSAAVPAGGSAHNNNNNSNNSTNTTLSLWLVCQWDIRLAAVGQLCAKYQKASAFLDSMATAASNPEQSYQAAAQSVNMALANSGILSNAGAYSQPAGGNGQQQGGGGSGASGSALNPLHYFYYPAAKESIQGPSKQADAMANSAGTQYQTMAAYPNYADQYQPSSYAGQGAGPDAAASSQDASFLPQPMDGQHQPHQNNQPPANNYNNQGDLASYASNQMQQQQPVQQQQQQQQPQQQGQPGGISFSGPTASSNQQQGVGPASGANDFMNAHMGGHQQQQQQAGNMAAPSYQQNAQNMFNQLASGGDLSTSNFGNNAGGMSSIASYMAPNGGLAGNAASNQQHDLFASGLFNGQFNSAASQVSPASISPPSSQPNAQAGQQQQSSLFSSSLFGSQAQQQPAGQQSGASSLFGGNANANSYLSSFLSPQQYSQLTGQQMGAMASEHTPLSLASAIGVQQQQQQQQAAASQSAGSLASATSSKRFGIGSFIMPMLALAGLSLLIPTMSNLGTAVGRRKRSVVEEKAGMASRQQEISYEPLLNGSSQLLKESSIGEYLERIERYYGIYRNAVESDECMSRLICELGDAVKDMGAKGPVMGVIERIVPAWMAGKVHLFREAALGGKEKCKKYVCHNASADSASRQH